MTRVELEIAANEYLKIMEFKKELLCATTLCSNCPLSSDNNGTSMMCGDFMLNYPCDFVAKLKEVFDSKEPPTWGKYIKDHYNDKIPDDVWRLLNDKQGT